jgi:ABC-type iron transport system FetAB permease component
LALITLIVIFYVLKGVFAGNIKKTLFTLLGFAVIIIIAYVLADGVETPLKDGGTLSASGSKWVGTGLYTFYIMALLAIAAMVWTGVTKLINR